MSDGEKTDLETALTIIGEISGDLNAAGVAEGFLPVRVRHLLTQAQAAEKFRTALASALDAWDTNGDADLIVQATSLLGYVRWCRQQEGQIRLRSALAFLNSPFTFERLDLDTLTPQQNEWRRALLALKDLRTAVDGVNGKCTDVMDDEEFPSARRACLDITHNMDVVLALLSAREGREALLSLIPDVAEGGELTSELRESDDINDKQVTLMLRGPWTPLAVEQYMRQVIEDNRDSGRQLSVVVNPPR